MFSHLTQDHNHIFYLPPSTLKLRTSFMRITSTQKYVKVFQITEVVQSDDIVISAETLRILHFFNTVCFYTPYGNHTNSNYFPKQN